MAGTDSLEHIDKDLKEVLDFCVSSGLTSSQIVSGARPLLDAANQSKRRAWLRRVVLVSLAVAVVAFLFQNTWTYRWICIASKITAMKVLPYWDWTPLYDEECILQNPYMVQDKLTEDDCQECVNYNKLEYVYNLTHEMVAEDYLFSNLPFIVLDATKGWKATSEFNADSLKKLFTENKVLRSHNVCQYTNNEGQPLADVLAGRASTFHTVWSNCQLQAIKVFRSYYHRPYFLPPMVEAALENFVAFSSGKSEKASGEEDEDSDFLKHGVVDDLTWFAQIRGNYFIQLRPKQPCDNICSLFSFVLEEGQTMVVTNDMWEWHFAPADSAPTIAIGSTGNWDS
ncbi:uncharacterized protein LOC117290814 [Asterias rubens]|uniref:uncharacterized protein LOC117290814 n=1 Tax=Asterias rubens TaxID=7604 RepID=UPI00145577EC|nr:uncharacterized protein LOC117290814 [Asterias rubens]